MAAGKRHLSATRINFGHAARSKHLLISTRAVAVSMLGRFAAAPNCTRTLAATFTVDLVSTHGEEMP
eukprot:6814837-Pyramimonas_sp.AAC.1